MGGGNCETILQNIGNHREKIWDYPTIPYKWMLLAGKIIKLHGGLSSKMTVEAGLSIGHPNPMDVPGIEKIGVPSGKLTYLWKITIFDR